MFSFIICFWWKILVLITLLRFFILIFWISFARSFIKLTFIFVSDRSSWCFIFFHFPFLKKFPLLIVQCLYLLSCLSFFLILYFARLINTWFIRIFSFLLLKLNRSILIHFSSRSWMNIRSYSCPLIFLFLMFLFFIISFCITSFSSVLRRVLTLTSTCIIFER